MGALPVKPHTPPKSRRVVLAYGMGRGVPSEA